MADSKETSHPGQYVRTHVVPKGVTVTQAAKALGVGRPALSNFLNCKASLSVDMAERLRKVFGADTEYLLQLQAQHDQKIAGALQREMPVAAYVPAILTIKARQIEDWSETYLDARSQLSALLRKLVHSTTRDLRKADFPAFDNAERKGWDGVTESGSATPWTPAGKAGWEFGCNAKPLSKANADYAARVESVPPDERVLTTFVFVTPRNWPGKADWEKTKTALSEWKAVKAFDASDIEQWLEQSVPAQIWFAEKLGLPVHGFRTLGQCWQSWSAAAEPPLTPQIFEPSIRSYRGTFQQWLTTPPDRPFIIAADSKHEALAFLACLMKDEEIAPLPSRDLPIVFDTSEPLKKLAASSAPFIPVVGDTDVERELAVLYRRVHCIVVRPRNAVDTDPDIALDLLRHDDFIKALSSMGVTGDRAERLSKESAQSPTILRRRLSRIDAIKTPVWAGDPDVARFLVPLVLVGAWHTGSKADLDVMSLVSGRTNEDVEEGVARLRTQDDGPVWSIGKYRGAASKIDALFAIAKSVVEKDIENFLVAAEYVLSERDPALDLPAEDRWAAGLYGKLRDHSGALRTGICETLVLLSVHGNDLFQKRLGINVESRVAKLIRQLLMPLALEKLLSHDRDLPNYAEAAPDDFLEIIEEDLRGEDPVVFGLMKPVENSFFGSGCPRSGLLWALEGLAWKQTNLSRVVRILAKLSTQNIDDNWSNKPEGSLGAIFRAWMPQTSASVDERIQAFELMLKEFPVVGWDICADQFERGSKIGHYSHRPNWRNDASGAGQVVSYGDCYKFIRRCIELALAWPNHNQKTLGDLVERLHAMTPEQQESVWQLIDQWATAADDTAKAVLRERIRRFAFTRRGRKRNLATESRDRARETYACLASKDPVLKHKWLFLNSWVDESADELEDEDFDFHKRDERIQKLRLEALREIWAARRFQGIADLLRESGASYFVGVLMAQLVTGPKAISKFAQSCIHAAKGDLLPKCENCLRGFLARQDADAVTSIIGNSGNRDDLLFLFRELSFDSRTWRPLDLQPKEFRAAYWKSVNAQWGRHTTDEVNELVDCLLQVSRPVAAFDAVHLDWKKVETSRLHKLLVAVAVSKNETPRPPMLQPHDIAAAIKTLGGRGVIGTDEMAHVEFMYIRALDRNGHGIPNLEKQIAKKPAHFVQAVALTFRRNDGKTDPPEWQFDDPEHHSTVATATHSLLDRITLIPGTDTDGSISVDELKSWLAEVRAACRRHGRADVGDQMIGQLLAKASQDIDGIWPCRPVCEAMEAVASTHIGRGFEIAVHNSRGAHWRGEGGDQERELAAKYRAWSQKLAFEYPYVAGVLESIAASYDHEAAWHDSDAKVRRRLP